jgi:hypothetical protein
MPSSHFRTCACVLCAAGSFAIVAIEGADRDCPTSPTTTCRAALPAPADAPEDNSPVRLFTLSPATVTSSITGPTGAMSR